MLRRLQSAACCAASTFADFRYHLFAAVILAVLGPAGLALCSPYTVYFGGTTTKYVDLVTNTAVPSNIGQPFSGWVTFDLANANSTVSQDSGGTYDAYSYGSTKRGCINVENGVCTNDVGAYTPVVTGYSISSPFAPLGGDRPFPDSAYLYDESLRENYRGYPSVFPPSGIDWYLVGRVQAQFGKTGDLEGAYMFTSVYREFILGPVVYNNGAFFSLVNDLLASPDSSVMPSGQENFDFWDYGYSENCNADGCNASTHRYTTGSHYWYGTLTSLRVAAGDASQVPEPTTFALLGLGLAGFGFSRRRQ